VLLAQWDVLLLYVRYKYIVRNRHVTCVAKILHHTYPNIKDYCGDPIDVTKGVETMMEGTTTWKPGENVSWKSQVRVRRPRDIFRSTTFATISVNIRRNGCGE